MTMTTEPSADKAGEPLGLAAERTVRPVSEAPRWWHCDTHGPGKLNAWGCPECVAELRRWKSTNAPRLKALEEMYRGAQIGVAAGLEARQTLASERAANAILTDEAERLRAALAKLVALKDIKARAENCWPGDEEGTALLRDYSSMKDAAWQAARDALGPNVAIKRLP
jgi:hypothetical protein